MLVLTRRKDQRIIIGDDIVVTVLEVKGDTVRIGIDAPRSVQVHREEVHEALSEANREALLPSSPVVGLPRVPRPAPPRGAAVRPPRRGAGGT